MELLVNYTIFAFDTNMTMLLQGYMSKYGFSIYDGSGYEELIAMNGIGRPEVNPYPIGSGYGSGEGASYGEAGINSGRGFGGMFLYPLNILETMFLSDFKVLMWKRFKECSYK